MLSVERVSELTSELTQLSESHGRTRTDGLTKTDSPEMNPAANASRAGGLERIINHGALCKPRAARFRDSQGRRVAPSSPLQVRHGFAAPSKKNFELRKTRSSAGRPLARENSQAASTPLTRRIQALQVGAHRHHFTPEMACSPVARWHGKSDGSNPLRPPTTCQVAGRCVKTTALRSQVYRTNVQSAAASSPVAVLSERNEKQ